ncbi:MAG: SLC13 family permease [Verrucomicrobia bacterium]|nr:SLC13 family permease [Verrucomicrobiota bacterium]
MTLPIALTLLVIALTLVAFIREWASPDVIALTVLCLVVALGLVGLQEMTVVFKNEAPLTIAALFVIGGALERSGAVDHIGQILKSRLSGNIRVAILAFSVLTAFFSAWMNNTAIVAILLPVTLGFARSKDIPASRLLMPLSYCSILGGCCTLIGTSTNLLVNGTLRDLGERPMSMFELAPVGIPLAIAGIGYLTIFGPRLIPSRSSITGSLDIESRTSPLYHLLLGGKSPLLGMNLMATPLADRESGIHVLEVRRGGSRLMLPLSAIVIQQNDRFLVALHRRGGRAVNPKTLLEEIGAQLLATVDGLVSELVVHDESTLLGETLAHADFRQRYNCVVLAVHRNGINLTKRIAELTLEVGDTLLVITPLSNLGAIHATRDFVLTDLPDQPDRSVKVKRPAHHVSLSWATLIGVVLVATLSDVLHGMVIAIPAIPIHYAAMVGALALLWLKIVTPREAYASIDWQVLIMLYGLLGLGMAMQNTHTAEWLAHGLVGTCERFASPAQLPMVLLWLVFLLTLLLTEVLSNNATAVMMVPIVVTLAHQLGVDARPFVLAVTVASSTAFALPMGYQTHMMIYGPGGYRFSDFLRVGIPLNLICWITACVVIPLIWPF